MQNNCVSILSTKILPQALLLQAEQLGVNITCVPFIYTKAVVEADVLHHVQSLGAKQITAVFTSSKAVAAVAAIITCNPHWNIYCLFGATKEQVQLHFPQSVIHATATDSASLANQLLVNGVKEAYFFCGNKRMDTIPQKVEGKLNLTQLVVYTTHSAAQKVESNFDGILFFSPSAVNSFFELNTITGKTVCFSVGNATAAALQPYTKNIVVAPMASNNAMLQEVLKKYDKTITPK